MSKKVYIIAGGTKNFVTAHLALSAPAYGSVGVQLYDHLSALLPIEEYDVYLVRTREARQEAENSTRMADKQLSSIGFNGHLETNEDMARLIDKLVADPDTRGIVMAASICDVEPAMLYSLDAEDSTVLTSFDKHAQRLNPNGGLTLCLKPSEKLIDRIRKDRKDIFLVSFKNGTDKNGVHGQKALYKAALTSLKRSSSNLVYGNGIVSGCAYNMIVTPEEFPYHYDTREEGIKALAKMTAARLNLTFNRTRISKDMHRFLIKPKTPTWDAIAPRNFWPVLRHCVTHGAYKPGPTGATTGHFGCKTMKRESEYEAIRLSSVRKADHNKVAEEGLVPIFEDEQGEVCGGVKPSVGETTQALIYKMLPDVDSIIHFHCPLRDEANYGLSLPIADQFQFECGSNECGMNTATNMAEVGDGIWVVHLRGHGPNIAWAHGVPYHEVIDVIEEHWDLAGKEGGLLV